MKNLRSHRDQDPVYRLTRVAPPIIFDFIQEERQTLLEAQVSHYDLEAVARVKGEPQEPGYWIFEFEQHHPMPHPFLPHLQKERFAIGLALEYALSRFEQVTGLDLGRLIVCSDLLDEGSFYENGEISFWEDLSNPLKPVALQRYELPPDSSGTSAVAQGGHFVGMAFGRSQVVLVSQEDADRGAHPELVGIDVFSLGSNQCRALAQTNLSQHRQRYEQLPVERWSFLRSKMRA